MTGSGRGDDEPDEFEFVDATSGRPPADEEIPTVPRARRSVGMLRRDIGLGAVVLIGALLVARAVTHKSGGPDPNPSRSPSGSHSTGPSPGALQQRLPMRTGDDPAKCPGQQCYTSSALTAEVRTAIADVFPTARIQAAETVRLTGRAAGRPLWYREVDARVGPAALVLRVQAHAAGDEARGGASDNGSRTVTFTQQPLEQWLVRVQLTDRSGAAQPFTKLTVLAADPRVLAVA